MIKKQKKVFITGGTGLLGHHLLKTAPKSCIIGSTYFPEYKKDYILHSCEGYHVDISDRNAVLEVIRQFRPDTVIHAASIASVDYIERNKEESRRTNYNGICNFIEACREIKAALIFVSSNAVFDGENPPYKEEDIVNPLNYYGKLKVEEEEAIRSSGLDYSIVRPILMYGWNLDVERKNPVTWLIDMLKDNISVNIVDDIFCNPLYVKNCADVIWKIIELNRKGVFHVAGEDEISRYEFACITAEVFGLDRNLINPVKNSFFKGIAPRPVNTTYCIDKIKRELDIYPQGVREGLKAMRNEK